MLFYSNLAKSDVGQFIGELYEVKPAQCLTHSNLSRAYFTLGAPEEVYDNFA